MASFKDINQLVNNRTLSASVLVDNYSQLIMRYKEHFNSALTKSLDNGSPFIVMGRLIPDGSQITDFLNGNIDEVTVWDGAGYVDIDDIDDLINDQQALYDTYLSFFDSLKTKTDSMADRVIQFKQDISMRNFTGERTSSLVEYLSSVLSSSTDSVTALFQATEDLGPSTVGPLTSNSSAFNATGVNVCSLWVTSLDIPTINISSFANDFTKAVTAASNIAKTFVANAANKIWKAGTNWINTNFIDTIDYSTSNEYEDLSCNQSLIEIGTVTINTSGVSTGLRSRLKHAYELGEKYVNFCAPIIGCTLYASCTNVSATSWSVTFLMKKHVYGDKFSRSLLGECVNLVNTSSATEDSFVRAIQNIVSAYSPLPDAAESSLDEAYAYLSMNRTSGLIPFGLLVSSASDFNTFEHLMRNYYAEDAYYDWCIAPPSGDITNAHFYNLANHWPVSSKSTILTLCRNVFDNTLTEEFVSSTNPLLGSKVAIQVSKYLDGAFNIKSDAALVAQFQSLINGAVAVAAGVALGVVAFKLKSKANAKYVENLRIYKNNLANPNVSATEVTKSFKKMNRWSKLANKSLVSSSINTAFNAPSALQAFSPSNTDVINKVNRVADDVATNNAKMTTVENSLQTSLTDVQNVITGQLSDVTSSITTVNNSITDVEESVNKSVDDINEYIDSAVDSINSTISSSQQRVESVINNGVNAINTNVNTQHSSTVSTISTQIGLVSTAITLLSGDLSVISSKLDNIVENDGSDIGQFYTIIENINQAKDLINNVKSLIE